MKRNIILVLTIVCLATVFSCSKTEKNSDDKKANAKTSINIAPVFTLEDIDTGDNVTLSDYKGRVVLVNFWATWCPPCQMEIPHLIELVDSYPDDFIVLGLSVDDDTAENVLKFVKSKKMNYPVVMASAEVVKAYGNISSIPTSFVINKEGIVVEKIVGYRSKDEFLSIIKKYF